MSLWNKIIDWLERRISLNEFISFITSFGIFYTHIPPDKPVKEAIKDAMETISPSYARWPYMLGIITFLLFLIQVVTGVLLLFFYVPSIDKAYESTVTIIRDRPFGFFIFNIHHWTAILLICVVLFRLGRFIYDKVFSPPREIFWILGFLIFIFVILEYITGIPLPMDAQAGWLSYRIFEIFNPAPFLGVLNRVLFGAIKFGDVFILRNYILHVFVFPLVVFFLFYIHFLSVRKVGLSYGKMSLKSPFPGYFFEILITIFITFGVVFTLATLFPRAIFQEFVPYKNYTQFKVPFFLLFFDFLRDKLPLTLYSIIFTLFIILPFFLPWIDRSAPVPLIKKPVAFILYFGGLLIIIVISVMGLRV